jgi:UDP-2,3-diacylglucosamine pyrophosphatase LpxH
MQEHKYAGYIGGHTHKPGHLQFWDTPMDIWNAGDFVDSMTCIVRTDDKLDLTILDTFKGGTHGIT